MAGCHSNPCGRRSGNKVGSKFKIAGHAHRCFHRVVPDDTCRNQALRPPARNRASKSVRIKALLVRLGMTGSPARGVTAGLKSFPCWPGVDGTLGPWNHVGYARRAIPECASGLAIVGRWPRPRDCYVRTSSGGNRILQIDQEEDGPVRRKRSAHPLGFHGITRGHHSDRRRLAVAAAFGPRIKHGRLFRGR